MYRSGVNICAQFVYDELPKTLTSAQRCRLIGNKAARRKEIKNEQLAKICPDDNNERRAKATWR